MSSTNSYQTQEDKIAEAIRLRDTYNEYVTNIVQPFVNETRPVRPTPMSWSDWDNREFNPEDALMTRDSVEIWQAYKIGGWRGLIEVMVEQVRLHQAQDMSAHGGRTTPSITDAHRYMIEDFDLNQARKMSSLLAHMQPDVLESIILGCITAKAVEEKAAGDPSFSIILKSNCEPANRPCIYVNELVNKEIIFGQKQKYSGRFLNWKEWKQLIPAMRQYWIEARTTPITPWVQKVQEQINNNKPLKNAIDQYLKTPHTFLKVGEFIDRQEVVYVNNAGLTVFNQNPNDPRLEIPYKRGVRETGWALYGHQRTSEHVWQKLTNDLWALLQSVSIALFGINRFEVKSYAVIPMTLADEAQVAEYMISQMGGSYWYQGAGGCNPVLAGSIAMHGLKKNIDLPKYTSAWQESQEFILDSGVLIDSVARQRASEQEWKTTFQQSKIQSREDWWDEHEKIQKEIKEDTEKLQKRLDEHLVLTACDELDAIAAEIQSQKAE